MSACSSGWSSKVSDELDREGHCSGCNQLATGCGRRFPRSPAHSAQPGNVAIGPAVGAVVGGGGASLLRVGRCPDQDPAVMSHQHVVLPQRRQWFCAARRCCSKMSARPAADPVPRRYPRVCGTAKHTCPHLHTTRLCRPPPPARTRSATSCAPVPSPTVSVRHTPPGSVGATSATVSTTPPTLTGEEVTCARSGARSEVTSGVTPGVMSGESGMWSTVRAPLDLTVPRGRRFDPQDSCTRMCWLSRPRGCRAAAAWASTVLARDEHP